MTVLLDDWGLERPLVLPLFYEGMWAQPRYAFLPLDVASYLLAVHERRGPLVWVRSASADATHDDQEVDLGPLGNPGGASWAYVALGYGDLTWTWGIMDRWLDEVATELVHGEARTQTEAKMAVQRWVDAQPG